MHAKFAAWRQAMIDLESAHRNNVAPHLRADAMRRAGETHEAVLREMVLQIDQLKRGVQRAADDMTSAMAKEDHDLAERIDLLAARLHAAEQAIQALHDAFTLLQAASAALTKEIS